MTVKKTINSTVVTPAIRSPGDRSPNVSDKKSVSYGVTPDYKNLKNRSSAHRTYKGNNSGLQSAHSLTRSNFKVDGPPNILVASEGGKAGTSVP